MNFLLDLTRQASFQSALLYLVTLFGATAMYVFSLNRGFEGAVAFLRRVVPGKKAVFYHRVDTVIVVVSGSIIGTIFFSPGSPLEALAAGFGWVSVINILMNQGPASSQSAPPTPEGAAAASRRSRSMSADQASPSSNAPCKTSRVRWRWP